MSHPRIAIVGATGAVGQEFLRVLEQRSFPFSELTLLASPRSAGKTMSFCGKNYTVEVLSEDSFADIDIAFFSAGGHISKTFAPIAAASGTVVVDNSSAFRMDENIPLVIPEVNPQTVANMHWGPGKGGIVANPNCSTILMLLALYPLHKENRITRVIASTYQAASGAGQAAMDELELQTREVLEGKAPTCDIFDRQYAFNLFSHNAPITENGYNEEEMKMVNETHKILGQLEQSPTERTQVSATCIRVPIMRAHAESLNIRFENPITEARAHALLAAAPGVTLQDDRESNLFPTPLEASHQDDIYIGRIRQDISSPDGKGIDLFLCGDQVRKGAALNAVQIAELLL